MAGGPLKDRSAARCCFKITISLIGEVVNKTLLLNFTRLKAVILKNSALDAVFESTFIEVTFVKTMLLRA